MSEPATPTFRQHVAQTLRARAREVAASWLRDIEARVGEDPWRIFPSQALLDHVPLMIRALADAVETGALDRRPELVHELQRLALLRRSQGYPGDEVLAEFQALHERLHDVVLEAAQAFPVAVPSAEALQVARLLGGAHLDLARTVRRAYQEEAMHEQLERARVLTTFGRTLNHELRNHIYALQMHVRLLREPKIQSDETRRAELLDRIKAGLGQMSDVARDVLTAALSADVTAPEADAGRPLSAIVRTLAADLSDLASRHQVKLVVEQPIPDESVEPARVQLALVNLVSNAIKYRDPAKPAPEVRIAARSEADGLVLQVEDNGLGIPREAMEHLFSLGVRGEHHDVPGDGLGLWAARQAIEPMGGKIEVNSELGQGSRFRVHLPRRGV